jgi:hypothetical protein
MSGGAVYEEANLLEFDRVAVAQAVPSDVFAGVEVLDDKEHWTLLRSGMLLTPRAPSTAVGGAVVGLGQDVLHIVLRIDQAVAEDARMSDFGSNNSHCRGRASMCKLCDEGQPRNYFGSRRNFLKGVAATGVAAAGLGLFAALPAAADGGDPPPTAAGRAGVTSSAAVR